MIAGGAACLLVALELARPERPRSRWLCALGGVALGITMFKSFGVIFAPVLLVAWLIGRKRTPRRNDRHSCSRSCRQALGLAATYGAWALFAAVFGFKGASLADITPSAGPQGPCTTYLAVLQQRLVPPDPAELDRPALG